MCWTSTNLTPLVSDGIKIIKICKIDSKGKLHGYYYNFTYKPHKIYTTKVKLQENKNGFGETSSVTGTNGFHCYSADECKIQIVNQDYSFTTFQFINVRHVNSNLLIGEYLGCEGNEIGGSVVVEGYIPKGATYYINSNGEIISERIVLTNIRNFD